MTFHSVFVNLRKKCTLDCCIFTNLNEINHFPNSLVDSRVFLPSKDVGSSQVAFKYIFLSFFLLVSSS